MDFEFDSRVDTVSLAEAGLDLELRDARGEKMVSQGGTVALTLLGVDSAKYRDTLDGVTRSRVEAIQKAKQAGTEVQEDKNAFTVDVLTAITLGWKNVNDKAGNAVPFNPENVAAFYQYPVIREQVDAFVSTRANFLKASSPA
jgi:hypothetical protein